MDVIVDGERSFKFDTTPSSILSAVAEITESLREEGRAVVEVKADGQVLTPDNMVDVLKDKSLTDVGQLEVATKEVSVLVNDELDDLERVLPDLPQACHSLAEVFQSDNPEDGYEPFYQLAEIWETVKKRQMQIASALDLDLDQLEIEGEPVARMHEALNGHLDEAARALQTSDCVTLGDLLEYELAPIAEKEAKIVALLRSRAQELSA